VTEPRLGAELSRRFGRIVWTSLTAYIVVMLVAFVALGEFVLARSSEQTADVIESLLGLYADPEGVATTVAPDMLADQLVGMGDRVAITRTTGRGTGDPMVYYLSPTMPAKRLASLTAASSPEDVQQMILDAIANRARWRYHILHRPAGEFDIYILTSRVSAMATLGGLAVVGIILLPITAVLTRRSASRGVARALLPLERMASETRAVHPDDLSRRVTSPTGQNEVTELADVINRMLERVERAQIALASFTADASHELRTPLTYLRAQAQWCLTQDRTPDEMRDAFANMQREVDRTTKMVDDLLTIARGENQQLVLERQPFDLGAVVEEVEEIARAMATGRDLDVTATVNAPVRALGDRDRTRQILLNLAANAVRYTPKGSVHLLARSNDGSVSVEVRDTGPGISADSIDRIFDRFYRGDPSRSRALGGSGLGLTIARVLAELQNGRIDVESTPGEGSKFTLWLPAAVEDRGLPAKPGTEGGQVARVDSGPAAQR
jgi:signal transduction histidine kinase